MPISLAEYQRRKAGADALTRDAARLRGKVDQLLERLATDYSVSDLDVADRLLTKLEGEAASAARAYTKAAAKFDKEYLNEGED